MTDRQPHNAFIERGRRPGRTTEDGSAATATSRSALSASTSIRIAVASPVVVTVASGCGGGSTGDEAATPGTSATSTSAIAAVSVPPRRTDETSGIPAIESWEIVGDVGAEFPDLGLDPTDQLDPPRFAVRAGDEVWMVADAPDSSLMIDVLDTLSATSRRVDPPLKASGARLVVGDSYVWALSDGAVVGVDRETLDATVVFGTPGLGADFGQYTHLAALGDRVFVAVKSPGAGPGSTTSVIKELDPANGAVPGDVPVDLGGGPNPVVNGMYGFGDRLSILANGDVQAVDPDDSSTTIVTGFQPAREQGLVEAGGRIIGMSSQAPQVLQIVETDAFETVDAVPLTGFADEHLHGLDADAAVITGAEGGFVVIDLEAGQVTSVVPFDTSPVGRLSGRTPLIIGDRIWLGRPIAGAADTADTSGTDPTTPTKNATTTTSRIWPLGGPLPAAGENWGPR